MISEKISLVNKYVSVPKDMGQMNPASFVAGIVKGILDSADFVSCLLQIYFPFDNAMLHSLQGSQLISSQSIAGIRRCF